MVARQDSEGAAGREPPQGGDGEDGRGEGSEGIRGTKGAQGSGSTSRPREDLSQGEVKRIVCAGMRTRASTKNGKVN